MAKKLKVQLVRSLIGVKETQKRTVQSLGLRKRLDCVEREVSPNLLGELRKVVHLVRIEEV